MKNTWLLGTVVLYLLACFLPEVKGMSPQGIFYLINPLALLVPAWWANPLFFAGCVALAGGKTGLASVLGVFAAMLAATFFLTSFPKFGFSTLLLPCFDFWFLSMVSLAASGLVVREEIAGPDKPDRLDDL